MLERERKGKKKKEKVTFRNTENSIIIGLHENLKDYKINFIHLKKERE